MKPKVWPWYLLYVGSLVFVYALCVLGGIAAVAFGLSSSGPESFELIFSGGIIAGFSLPALVGFAIAPFLPPKKWVWVYNLVLIGLGMGSCLWLPLSLFLLIKFTEPDVRNYFGA